MSAFTLAAQADVQALRSLLNRSIELSEKVFEFKNNLSISEDKRQGQVTAFASVVVGIMYMMLQTPIAYISDCRLNLFHTLIPSETCALEQLLRQLSLNENPSDFLISHPLLTIFVFMRWACFEIVQVAMAVNYMGGILVYVVFLYPTLFSTLDILKHLRQQSFNTEIGRASCRERV